MLHPAGDHGVRQVSRSSRIVPTGAPPFEAFPPHPSRYTSPCNMPSCRLPPARSDFRASSLERVRCTSAALPPWCARCSHGLRSSRSDRATEAALRDTRPRFRYRSSGSMFMAEAMSPSSTEIDDPTLRFRRNGRSMGRVEQPKPLTPSPIENRQADLRGRLRPAPYADRAVTRPATCRGSYRRFPPKRSPDPRRSDSVVGPPSLRPGGRYAACVATRGAARERAARGSLSSRLTFRTNGPEGHRTLDRSELRLDTGMPGPGGRPGSNSRSCRTSRGSSSPRG